MSTIPSTPADGMVRTDVVTAIADITAPKAATELAAASSKAISCYITAGGSKLDVSQDEITDDRECDKFSAKAPGRKKIDSPSLTVIDNTGTANSSSNAAIEALTEGSTVYIVRRYGLAFDAAWAAAQKVDVFKCIVGAKQRMAPEANSVFRSLVPLYVQDYKQDATTAA